MYLGRVNGYAILMMFVGIGGHYLFGEKILVVSVPLAMMWAVSYIESSYNFKQKKQSWK